MAQFLQLSYGDIFAEGYRILQPLSQGGMGAVYLVEQLATAKRRALKLMHPDLVVDAKLLKRFEQEARVGALIESDHVVEVIDAGVEPQSGIPWLAMELLQGEDLAAYVRRKGALSPSEVRSIFAQLCHALGAAHALGIVHRDLKPENIFLATPRREGISYTLKVLDFGVAKVVAEASATATAAIGTPLWMAPEQMASDGLIEPSTDVWALGLLAYRLLTGGYYWRSAEATGGSLMSIMREVGFDPLPRASERAQESGVLHLLPENFDAWFARCVTRHQPSRFRSANEVKAQLDALLGTISPVPSGPIPLFIGEQKQAGSITLVGRTGPLVEAYTEHNLDDRADLFEDEPAGDADGGSGGPFGDGHYNETTAGLSTESDLPPRPLARAVPGRSKGTFYWLGAGAAVLACASLWYRSTRAATFIDYGEDETEPSPSAPPPVQKASARTEPQRSRDATLASVAGGKFTMVDVMNAKDGRRVESHWEVVLKPYAIDKKEVTVEQFRACVEAGRCEESGMRSKLECNYGKKSAESSLINCVDYDQAETYCQYRGKRLPTEEEWEYAARSQAVLTFSERSKNTWEWTSTLQCPGGAQACAKPARVARGSAPLRLKLEPSHRDTDLGFRCAKEP